MSALAMLYTKRMGLHCVAKRVCWITQYGARLSRINGAAGMMRGASSRYWFGDSKGEESD